MEPIKLTGAQIVDTKKMKQSGRYRITLELTEEDTKFNGGSLAVAEINDLIADVELTFTEIQGNNNGHEKSLLREPTKPKERSVYQRFKDLCIAYSGEGYYNRLKKHLGVEHLKDLETRLDPFHLGVALGKQDSYITSRRLGFTHEEAVSALQDGNSNNWEMLFEDFNNPKK